MKKLISLISSLVVILVISCKKDVSTYNTPTVQGQVQFTVTNNISLKQTYRAIKNITNNEYTLRNFYYTKTIPNDSMGYYWRIFKSCSFITVFDIFQKTGDTFTRFRNFSFQNLDDANFSKWDSIVQKENLIAMPDAGDGLSRSGVLFVPNGQEKTWINKLKELPEVSDAGYIYALYGPM